MAFRRTVGIRWRKTTFGELVHLTHRRFQGLPTFSFAFDSAELEFCER